MSCPLSPVVSSSLLWLALVSPAPAQTAWRPPEAARLAPYGDWQALDPYGLVWFPRAGPAWRPYSRGTWQRSVPAGWSWHGLDPWSSPTERGGRWGLASGAWFWIPGPALPQAPVAWAIAPDYIGWCPLGPHDRPVEPLALGARSHAWTVVRRVDLGTANAVGPGLDVADLPRTIPFIVQRIAPAAEPASLTIASRQPMMSPAERDGGGVTAPAAPPAAPSPAAEIVQPEPAFEPFFWGFGFVPFLSRAPHARRHREANPPDFEPHFQPRFAPRFTPHFDVQGNGTPRQRSGAQPPRRRAPEHLEHLEHPGTRTPEHPGTGHAGAAIH